MTEEQRELWELIEDVRPAMMTTVERDGTFRSRPMWTQGDEFDGSLWFFTSDEAPNVDELERNPRVCLAYAAPDKLAGQEAEGAPVRRDRARRRHGQAAEER